MFWIVLFDLYTFGGGGKFAGTPVTTPVIGAGGAVGATAACAPWSMYACIFSWNVFPICVSRLSAWSYSMNPAYQNLGPRNRRLIGRQGLTAIP